MTHQNQITSIYVASSWRNTMQQATVSVLRAAGFEVYDFRNPPNATGFAWHQIDLTHSKPLDSKDGTEDLSNTTDYLRALKHPRAIEGFNSDMDALKTSDAVVLVLPCGKSAHLELGWASGAGKPTCVYTPNETMTPELMYLMCDHIAPSMMDLLDWLGVKD
jgi:hypothetical protein